MTNTGLKLYEALVDDVWVTTLAETLEGAMARFKLFAEVQKVDFSDVTEVDLDDWR